MRQPHTANDNLLVKIGEREFIVRVLRSAHFLVDPEGFPISFFIADRPKTMLEKTLEMAGTYNETLSAEEEKKRLQGIKLILKKGVLMCDGADFDVDAYFEAEPESAEQGTERMAEMFQLFSVIVDISFKKFKTTQKLGLNTILFYDKLAARYGGTPIEHLFPEGGYSDLDSYIFNGHIMTEAWRHENEMAEKQIAAFKSKAGRR